MEKPKSLIRELEVLSYKFYGTVLKIVDGDTVKIDVDLGFTAGVKVNIRIAGINAPELNTPAGKASQAYLMSILPIGTKVVIHTEKYRQSFTRYVGDIYLDDGTSLATLMVNAGFAVVVSP